MVGKASAGSIFQKLCNKILQNILLCQKFPYVKVTTTFSVFHATRERLKRKNNDIVLNFPNQENLKQFD